MKVLHVIPSIAKQDGGPSQAIFPMCRALREQGIEVLLATTDSGLEADEIVREKVVSRDGLDLICFPAQVGRSFKYSRPFTVWLNENVGDFDVVHIHAVFNHASIAAARACRKNRVPYIVRPLGTLDPWSMGQKPLRKKVFLRSGISRMLAGASAIHYTTEAEQEAVEQSLGLNHGVVVPLGVDYLATSGKQRAQAPLPDREIPTHRAMTTRYVVVLSRLHPKKGLDVLIRAFLSLVAKHEFKDVQLVLAGTGDEAYVNSLKSEAREHPSIVFAGWVGGTDKESLLRNASVLALPSYQENFAVCVLESLAVGTPVVVSPQVNLAKQIECAGAGWVVDIDELKLEQVLGEALRNHEERERRGAAGRRFAQGFTWPAVAPQLVAMYEAVLKRGTGILPVQRGRDAHAMLENITPLILTFNEAANIDRTLQKLTWARDIVIVDSFSTDETLEIAAQYPQVRVVQRAFDSHENQWNFGLNKTGINSTWILSLDADYVVTDELISELKTLQPQDDIGGFEATFVYCINGKRLRSGIYPPVTVLFRRGYGNYVQDGHTQKLAVSAATERLRAPILHDDRKPLTRWLEAQSRYTKLEAEKLSKTPGSALGWKDWLRKWRVIAPPSMLLYCLIIRGGVLDGWAGFYYAFQRALAELMLSLYLLEKTTDRRPSTAEGASNRQTLDARTLGEVRLDESDLVGARTTRE